MKPLLIIAAFTWTSLWITPDQQGRRQFERGDFKDAAESFTDPIWQGTAWYKAGEFEKAAQAFALRDTAEAQFNQGNAWLMNGKYETAISCYDRALTRRADWKEAIENRDLAAARAKMVEAKGGDMGDQTIGADEIRFDANKKPGGEETEITGEQAGSDASIQAMWLRRVQTKPADFLKAKFFYQLATEGGEE